MSENTVYVPETPGQSIDYDDVDVDGTVGGVVLLEANPNRKSALIMNVGAQPMRVTTDGSAPTATHGKQVVAGGVLNLTSPFCPTDEVRAIRQGGTSTSANASEVI